MRARKRTMAMLFCCVFVAVLVVAGVGTTWRNIRPGEAATGEPNLRRAPVPTASQAGPAHTGAVRRSDDERGPVHRTHPEVDTLVAEVIETTLDDVSWKCDDILAKIERRKIHEAQDVVMGKWPKYSDVRAQYCRELASIYDMNSAPEGQLVEAARALRDAFWSEGACSSPGSYTQIYKARILLERAHERFPDDLKVIDELVETVQSYNMVYHVDNAQGRYVYNGEYLEEMIRLRAKQFRLVQQQILAGRAPTMQDFTCACDLAYIVQGKNKPAAKRVVTWLRNNAGDTWPQYGELLSSWETILDQGLFHQFPIYVANEDGAYDPVYQRRLPSFRGPKSRSVAFWSKDKPYVLGSERDSMRFQN